MARHLGAAALLAALCGLPASGSAPAALEVLPDNPFLFGSGAEQRLLVLARYEDGRAEDVTSRSRFRSAKPSVAGVGTDGVVRARAFGGAVIEASFGSLKATTTALVQRADAPLPVAFGADVLPVLTKLGCNGGNCHGAMNGQNGFKLSLFGYRPADDYRMIVEADGGRRIDLRRPENSLLLRKPTFATAHGGGQVMAPDSEEYRALLTWIRDGARLEPAVEKRLVRLQVDPSRLVLHGEGSGAQLLVTALFSDGTQADFTGSAHFESHDGSVAEVDSQGRVTSRSRGETTVLVRGLGAVSVARIGVVTTRHPVPDTESDHVVDRHVLARLKDLHVPPSPLADDATFLRRAFLDVIGVVPTASEAREFLSSRDPDKRAKLVDALLERPEYADFWALYWGDHLNNTKQLLYNKGPYTFTRWLYERFRENTPYDQFVRALLTSSGNMYDSPATSYYPLMKKPLDLAAQTSQLFLGVSLECARCHDHPLEKWTQDDYNGMAAFFSQVRYKGGAGPRNNERVLYVDFDRQFEHPESGRVHAPKPLGGPPLSMDAWTDRREALADWMTAPDNPYFAKAIVNRIWKQFLGRGIVEPVDDFRDTNPPFNPGLLDALALELVDSGFDLQHLIRVIASSRTYQLSSLPNEANRDDASGHSRYYARRLTAEQLLDSISQVTGVPEEFPSLYPGTRASQLPEPEVPSYFLDVFDRPSRQVVSDRARTNSLNQALHLIGGETVEGKIGHPDGTLSRLLEAGLGDTEIVEELYLGALARYPDDGELEASGRAVAEAGSRQAGLEDVFWALLNSKEFLYQH